MAAVRSTCGGAAMAAAKRAQQERQKEVHSHRYPQCTKLNVMHWSWKLGAAALLIRAAAPAAPFTIEQAISAPFPSDLTASPTGSKLAWVFDEKGARNVWVAEAPDYHGRRLTNYKADDGQEITELQWSPDGRIIVYVRGRRGRTPAASIRIRPAIRRDAADGVGGAVSGGEPREIGEGSTPAVGARPGLLCALGPDHWRGARGRGRKRRN